MAFTFQRPKFFTALSIVAAVVLMFGLGLTVFSTQQKQDTRTHASSVPNVNECGDDGCCSDPNRGGWVGAMCKYDYEGACPGGMISTAHPWLCPLGDNYRCCKDAGPQANAGSPQTITLPTNSVTLNGSCSDADTDSRNLDSCNWTKLPGSPAGGTISHPTSTSGSNSTQITDLQQGVYTFNLKAWDGFVGDDSTVTVTVNAPTNTPPTTPINLAAVAKSATRIDLTWTASTDNVGVTGYKIFRNATQIGISTTNSYSDTAGLLPSTQYTYTVSAYDASNADSGLSNQAQATTQDGLDTTDPSNPTNLAAAPFSSTQINLTWTASTDNKAVTGYKIFRDGNEVGTSATNSYQDKQLTPSTEYRYKVQAYDAAGNISGDSNEAVATTQVNPTAKVSLDLFLHGIGKSGDSQNPESTGGNKNLTRFQRQVIVEVYNAQNQPVTPEGGAEGLVLYNSTSGSFKGEVDLGNGVTGGAYTVKVKLSQSLKTLIPGIQMLQAGIVNAMPTVTLVNGDIDNNNALNILDYNILEGCFSELKPAKSCTPENKIRADISDDGFVNGLDYNLFIREFSNFHGS